MSEDQQFKERSAKYAKFCIVGGTGVGVDMALLWRGEETNRALVKFNLNVKLRSMNDRIVIDPRICHGKPVIRGTRMPVSLVVGSLAGGMSFEEVEREYGLTRDDIRAALKFAGELVEQEQHHPLASAAR